MGRVQTLRQKRQDSTSQILQAPTRASHPLCELRNFVNHIGQACEHISRFPLIAEVVFSRTTSSLGSQNSPALQFKYSRLSDSYYTDNCLTNNG